MRRRAHSLNFAIRSSQPVVDNSRLSMSKSPSVKRRRIEPMSNLFLLENNLSQRRQTLFTIQSINMTYSLGTISQLKLASQEAIQKRNKTTSTKIKNKESISTPQKPKQSTRRRRRTDPYIRTIENTNDFFLFCIDLWFCYCR